MMTAGTTQQASGGMHAARLPWLQRILVSSSRWRADGIREYARVDSKSTVEPSRQTAATQNPPHSELGRSTSNPVMRSQGTCTT